MPDRPGSNADEVALTPTERREVIHATLTLARQLYELWGDWPKTQDIEAYLTGARSL